MTCGNEFDQNPALVDNYERAPRWFVPGYDASHAMAAVLLRDRIDEHGRILVVGAGGGVELSVFARECGGWTFAAIDPSVEMLKRAQAKIESIGALDRVSWVQGLVENSPHELFDGATAFLALSFIPDDGQRLDTLREIHARLKPGAPFLMINGCTDKQGARFEDDLRVYAAFARRGGAPAEMIESALRMQRESLHPVPREREERLLAEAGFNESEIFYAGLMVFGWIARA
jgi:tRNA (cmo5U34)-methyltransferase